MQGKWAGRKDHVGSEEFSIYVGETAAGRESRNRAHNIEQGTCGVIQFPDGTWPCANCLLKLQGTIGKCYIYPPLTDKEIEAQKWKSCGIRV